jgi:hypothetical protein
MAPTTRLIAASVGLLVVSALASCADGAAVPARTSAPPGHSAVGSDPSAVDAPVHQEDADRQVVGFANGVNVTITPRDRTVIRPGGAPLRFTVALVNIATTDYAQVGLVVSLGHCSCNPTGSRMMPAGTMNMFDPGTNAWLTVPYVAEGTGGDFLSRTVVPRFALPHGQALVYRFQLRLNGSQAFAVGAGASSIDVTLTSAATNTPVGSSPTVSLPVSVRP